MSRMTNLRAIFFFAFGPLALAQSPPLAHDFPEDALTARQLIAWSWLQKPQPTPQPLPPRDTPIPQPDQPQAQPSTPPADAQTPPPTSAQSFVGRIVKDSGKYVLKVAAGTTYQLAGVGDPTQYENQNVKVIGSLDKDGTTIHVAKIELLS